MSGSILDSSIVKLITVFLVFSATFNRTRKTKLQWIINASVIAVTLPLCILSEGRHGTMICCAGAVTALFLALPLYRFGWMTRIDILTTCIIGMHVGPAGFAFAYGIALGFVIAQHCLKARTSIITGHLCTSSPFYPPALYHGAIRPSLVEMESHRMLDDDRRERITLGESSRSSRGCTFLSTTPVREEVLPWAGKIAIATLAVLMLGITS